LNVDTALKKLEKNHGKRRALSLIGFAMFVDMYGAAAMRRKYDRMTVWRDLKALQDAEVDPALIDWGEVEKHGQGSAASPRGTREKAAGSRR